MTSAEFTVTKVHCWGTYDIVPNAGQWKWTNLSWIHSPHT